MATRQDEFEQIVMRHSRSLLRVARRLSPDAAASEDLVQETLLLAWRNFHQFQAGTNARAWLFRILFNSAHSQTRKQRAAPFLVSASIAEPEAAPGFDFSGVTDALDALHAEHRTVLLLAVVEGFTCREISEILSLPIGTVMSRLSRARRALRAQMTPSAKCAEKEA